MQHKQIALTFMLSGVMIDSVSILFLFFKLARTHVCTSSLSVKRCLH
jgi:hypothetical protein